MKVTSMSFSQESAVSDGGDTLQPSASLLISPENESAARRLSDGVTPKSLHILYNIFPDVISTQK